MAAASNDRISSRKDAKEYARFCRIYGLFLVDGIEPWRTALRGRGLSEVEIGRKISAATDFIKRLGEPSSEREGA